MAQTPSASTREAYGAALVELGRENPDIVVLGGDLNVSTFTTPFAKEFPDRFFDFGAAEQNILSVAAGLASAGKVPFCSTFAVFGTGRAFDQMRVGVAQPSMNVKLVCTHAGLITGEDGVSAQAIEDVALMLSLPTVTVLTPSDGPETVAAVRAAAEIDGPVYVRLYRPALPVLHSNGYEFRLGEAETLREGGDVTLVACGSMVAATLEAAEMLASEGTSARVLNMHTLRPFDEEAVARAARETGALGDGGGALRPRRAGEPGGGRGGGHAPRAGGGCRRAPVRRVGHVGGAGGEVRPERLARSGSGAEGAGAQAGVGGGRLQC